MKLWTIQSPAVYDLLQKTGIYHCDPDLSENPEEAFRKAYAWMHAKMEIQIGPAPEGVTDPVWAWHTWVGNRRKPDFRTSLFRNSMDCYLMEIEVPDDEVLLTDYNDWHYVLNEWWYHDEDPDEIWEKRNEWWWSLPYKERKESEMELLQKKDVSIQAVFWELRYEQILKIWFYPARKK